MLPRSVSTWGCPGLAAPLVAPNAVDFVDDQRASSLDVSASRPCSRLRIAVPSADEGSACRVLPRSEQLSIQGEEVAWA
jgi:hypothetical protein